MQRRYPPFGVVPALVPGHAQLLGRTDRTVIYLAGFLALPQGVLAAGHVVRRAEDVQGAVYAFEVLDGAPATGTLHVWAEFTEPDSPEPVRVAANLVSGGGGQDAGLDARSYLLWFPVDIATLQSDLTFLVRWDDAGVAAGPLVITRTQLREAARSAISV